MERRIDVSFVATIEQDSGTECNDSVAKDQLRDSKPSMLSQNADTTARSPE